MGRKFKKVKWLNCDANCTIDGVMKSGALSGWGYNPMFQAADGKYYAIVPQAKVVPIKPSEVKAWRKGQGKPSLPME